MLIAAFQFYWINRLYKDEWQNLKKETDVIFRDVMYKLQLERFRNDTAIFKKGVPDNLFVLDVLDSVRNKLLDSATRRQEIHHQRQIMVSVSARKNNLPADTNTVVIQQRIDSFRVPLPPPEGAPRVVKYFSTNKTLNDTFPLSRIASAYRAELNKNNITLPFTVKSFASKDRWPDTIKAGELKTSFTFVGLAQARGYQANFADPFSYILSKIKYQALFALLLVALTVISFIFLYTNLVNQRKLAVMKNEFISNITHELKTPVATVSVAVEALKNFNVLQSPEKSQEYLEISASELQRLSLLVDKVLRLTMFENKDIELKKEHFDLYRLTEEIIGTMKLQFDKAGAKIDVAKQGDRFVIEADKLHITSLIYNLLDNALKYSNGQPEITVKVVSHEGFIEWSVSDKGIGIAKEYKQKIFDKFFRVPANGHHNTKGYGLGLSYVNHVAKRHLGFIELESELGRGSTFSVKLPYELTDVINYDKGRGIRRNSLWL